MFPDDVNFAFVAGYALANSDDESAKFGNLVGEAVEAIVVTVEALVDGVETLVDEAVPDNETTDTTFSDGHQAGLLPYVKKAASDVSDQTLRQPVEFVYSHMRKSAARKLRRA